MILTFKDKLAITWFLATSLAIALLMYLYDRRGKRIEELLTEIQQRAIQAKLAKLQEASAKSDEDYKNAQDSYASLKRRHAALLDKLGISGPVNSTDAGRDSSAH